MRPFSPVSSSSSPPQTRPNVSAHRKVLRAGRLMRRLAFVVTVMACAAPAFAQEPPMGFDVPFALAPRPFLQWLPDLLAAQPFIPLRPDRRPPSRAALDRLIAAHAEANGVPESFVHRVVKRESRYDATARGRGGAMGLMQ